MQDVKITDQVARRENAGHQIVTYKLVVLLCYIDRMFNSLQCFVRIVSMSCFFAF